MLLGIISAAVSVVGAIGQARAGRKARKANAAAARTEKEIRSLRNMQAKRRFLKDARLAQAELLSIGGAIEGGLDSSRTQGAMVASRSQAQVGAAEQQKLSTLDASAVNSSLKAAQARNSAAMWSAGTSIVKAGLSVFPEPGGNGVPTVTEMDIPEGTYDS